MAAAVYEAGGSGIHLPLDGGHALVVVLKMALEREGRERPGKQWKVVAFRDSFAGQGAVHMTPWWNRCKWQCEGGTALGEERADRATPGDMCRLAVSWQAR